MRTLVLGALVLLAFPYPALFAEGPVRVSLETAQSGVYRRQEMILKLVFVNEAESTVTLDPSAFSRESFSVKDPEGRPPRKTNPTPPAPVAEEAFSVIGYDKRERLVDLTAWYPGLTLEEGPWDVAWSHGEWKAGPLKVRIVEPYNPKKDRQAIVRTELGTMTWELLPQHAPEHVKHFVTLARNGYYDGLSIFRVMAGVQADGGDPKENGTGGWDRLLPPEISPTLPMEAGLVGAARRQTSMTSDSVFFITLGPADFMAGKHTFFGRVKQDGGVLDGLGSLPTKGETGFHDEYVLLKPVRIHSITIK